MSITKEEFVREWVKDLRSGRYGQMQKQLGDIDNNRYCCLGVACLTGARLGIEGAGLVRDSLYQDPASNYESRKIPSLWFEDIMGDSDPFITLLGGTQSCSSANDLLCLTFEEIADALEATYLGR